MTSSPPPSSPGHASADHASPAHASADHASPADGQAGELLRIHGSATPEDVAAIVAVLAAAADEAASDSGSSGGVGGWTDHGRRMRHTLPHGSGAWRSSLR